MIWILATFVVVFFLYLFFKNEQKGPEPPGPKGWPFIGVATQIDPKGLHHSLTKWSEEYGDVFQFTMFGDTYLALNSYETIHDVLVGRSDDFAGRPVQYSIKTLTAVPEIIFSDISPRWRTLKKLLMQKFKTYGSNIQFVEKLTNQIYDEDILHHFVKAAETGEAFNAKPILHLGITNIMGSMIFGRNSKAMASVWLKYQEEFDSTFKFSLPGYILDKFPWTRVLPGIKPMYNAIIECSLLHQSSLKPEIKISRDQFYPNDVKSFVDELLKHQMDFGTNPEHGGITDDEIYALTFDMFTAGTITTTLTIQALIACLVNKPELQAKLAKQIYDAIETRKPTTQDRQDLPLVEATLLEILRYQTLVPMLLPHKTMRPVTMKGFKIEKDVLGLVNVWKLSHDPEFWQDPYDFQPERFIEDGKVVAVDHPKRKRLFPFGAGRRACTGENIGKTRLFLLVTEILRDFELLPESEEKRPKHDCRDYVINFNMSPKPYKIRLKSRCHQGYESQFSQGK